MRDPNVLQEIKRSDVKDELLWFLPNILNPEDKNVLSYYDEDNSVQDRVLMKKPIDIVAITFQISFCEAHKRLITREWTWS